MKKLILLALAAVIMAGCDGRKVSSITDDANIVIIDSCEYIKNATYTYLYVYTHKGNCRFCKERREKEIKELLRKE